MARTIKLSPDATETDIINALTDLPDGGTIVLPENKTIDIRSGIDINVSNRSITLDLNGSVLRKAGDNSVINARGVSDDPSPVKLGVDAKGNTVATYKELPDNLDAGAWVKIVSEDKLPGDHYQGKVVSRMGQAMEVLGVEGNTVTFKGAVIDQSRYDTNVRAAMYNSGELVVKNGEIAGNQKHEAWNMPLLQLRSVVDAQVENLTVRDGVGRGIGVIDSVNTLLTDITAKNLMDGGTAALGIAVSSASSLGTTVRGLFAEDVTHATDNDAIGTVWGSRYIERYGGDIGMDVANSVAIGTRNFAWSWHSEAVKGSFDNVMAFDSYGMLMGRGTGGEMTNSGGVGNERGLMFYEYGDKDGRDITIDGVTLRETENWSVFAAGDPRGNTIEDSSFEAYGPGILASLLQVVSKASKFLDADSNANDVLTGTGGQDMLLGGKGLDQLTGGAGNDYLWGGKGDDTLAGGYGRDRFVFLGTGEGKDSITDFQAGAGGDILDLSVLAARCGWGKGDPFADGYIRLVQNGGDVDVKIDTNGDGRDFVTVATLENVQGSALGAANFGLSLSDAFGGAPAAPPASAPPPAPAPEPSPAPQPAPSPGPEPAPAPAPSPTVGKELWGTGYDDVLRGDIGVVRIVGGGGADKLSASTNDTLLEGGNGDDVVSGNRGNDLLKGGAGHDWMSGGDGEDRLYGDNGDDTLRGGSGADMLAGGRGYDTADYGDCSSGMTADLKSASGNAGDARGDRYSSIENLRGSEFSDTLLGNKVANTLEGGNGHDKLYGREGADTLIGGDGNDWLDGGTWKDVLTGGNGSDSFFLASASQDGDTITDFEVGVDHLVLSGSGFGIDGHDDFAFVEGLAPTSAEATVLYDRDGGQLLWDSDGTGGRGATVLVKLSVNGNFSESDLLIG